MYEQKDGTWAESRTVASTEGTRFRSLDVSATKGFLRRLDEYCAHREKPVLSDHCADEY